MRSTGLCLFALLAAALFLFSVTDGNFLIHGDDMYILHHFHHYHPEWSYVRNMGERQFLTLAYVSLLRALGDDTHRMHNFFLAWHVLNAWLCFLVLRRLFSARPALAGSLLYLVYTGPLETLTWLAAGGYLPVMTIFFVSVWIALSDWNPWKKGIAIAALNWIAMHFYEVLLIAAPLYPALEALRRRRNREPPLTRDFLATLIPLAVLCLHWSLMYAGSRIYNFRPYWMRNPDMKMDPISLLKHMYFVGQLAFSTCCGPMHWDWLRAQINGLLWHGFPGPGYWFWLAMALVALVAAWIWAGDTTPTPRPPFVLLTSAYLILVTPLIGVTLIVVAVPSRLLVLCGAGLALLAAFIVARWPYPAVALLILVTAAAEGLAMQSAFVQEQTARVVDADLRGQLAAFHLHPRQGDQFFFSIKAPPERYQFWRAASPQFYSPDVDNLLLMEYGMVRLDDIAIPDRLPVITPELRGDRGPDFGVSEMNVPLPAPGQTLFAFRAPDEGKLQACIPLQVVAGDRVLREYSNPAFATLPADLRIAARAAAAWLSGDSLRLNFYQPDLVIEIHGRVFATPENGKLEVRDGEKIVAAFPVSKPTDLFLGGIPLSALRPDSLLKITASPGVDWQYRVSTFSAQWSGPPGPQPAPRPASPNGLKYRGQSK